MSDVFQKVPPQNLEAEQALLGSMMMDVEAVVKAMENIVADDFYQASHRGIYQALLNLYQANRPCDMVTLQEELRAQNRLSDIGGASYLSQLLNVVPTAANADHYAKIVKEKSLLRQLIGVTGEIARTAYEPQVVAQTILDEAQQKVLQLSQKGNSQSYVRIRDLASETFKRLERLYEHKQAVTGVATGFSKLDEMTSGFQASDLIILAARPSMGKTAFCLNIAQHVAGVNAVPVLIFSLEMSRYQLMQRLIVSEARIDGQKIRNGYLADEDWAKLTMTVGVLAETPIFIDDSPNMTLMEVRSKARRAKAQENIGLIVIDYLQMMSLQSGGSSQDNRVQEISAISRGLKGIARELGVPVVCLSQLSRAVESRPDKRPMLSDLRESGAIEQDADVVIFLYREEYYNRNKAECKNRAEVIIAKQRNGPVGTCDMAFFPQFARYDNLETMLTEEYMGE
ncbi:MAG TPA: replicative DNA helicase [Candidatus Ozemobacteraceae bacterium]|nr:replicative DNA helicase [Candidatus Ozemobacteraceae bacterium]